MSKGIRTRSIGALVRYYEADDTGDFYEHIFDVYNVGQQKQSKKMFHEMRIADRKEFIEYCIRSKNPTEALELLAYVIY